MSICLANFSRVSDGNCPSLEITGRNRHSCLKQGLTRVHRSTRWTASPGVEGREGGRGRPLLYLRKQRFATEITFPRSGTTPGSLLVFARGVSCLWATCGVRTCVRVPSFSELPDMIMSEIRLPMHSEYLRARDPTYISYLASSILARISIALRAAIYRCICGMCVCVQMLYEIAKNKNPIFETLVSLWLYLKSSVFLILKVNLKVQI